METATRLGMTTSRYLRRVLRKLNWLVFLEHCGSRCVLVPLIVALPTVVCHLLLRRPFPVMLALIAGAAGVIGSAVWRTWQRRYLAGDVRAFVDSWLGGKGALLVEGQSLHDTVTGPVPGTRWRWAAARGGVTACATLFVCYVPILERPLPSPLVTHSTRRLEEKLEDLDKLALLSEAKREELAAALAEFTEATEKMSTEEFWHANDQFATQLDQALAESQSTFEQAAAAMENPLAAGTSAMKSLAQALSQLLKNPANAAALAELSPELAKKLAALAEQARAGNLEDLAKALNAMSPAELQQLARQLEQQAAQAQAGRLGPESEGGSIGGLAAALEQQLARQGFTEATGDGNPCGACTGCRSGGACTMTGEGSGRGGVTRGPGTNNRLFGNESPDLTAAMENTLLPGASAHDPGMMLEKTELPAAPRPGPEQWGQPVNSGGPVAGTEALSADTPTVAPRYRPSVSRYFSK